jgi:hypothetical protein
MSEHAREYVPEATPEAPAAAPATFAPALGGTVARAMALQRAVGNRAASRVLSRKVRLEAPRKGTVLQQADAFPRRQDLVDRMNSQGLGAMFSVGTNGELSYNVLVSGFLSPFEKRMIEYIDAGAMVPMRLLQKAGTGVVIDQYFQGFVDLDDLLASDDLSFQLNMIHIIHERLFTGDYAAQLDKGEGPNFQKAHRSAIAAEARHLQEELGDTSIEFAGESVDTQHLSATFVFRSKDHGYTIIHHLNTRKGAITGGSIGIRQKGVKGEMTVEQFRERRAAG